MQRKNGGVKFLHDLNIMEQSAKQYFVKYESNAMWKRRSIQESAKIPTLKNSKKHVF